MSTPLFLLHYVRAFLAPEAAPLLPVSCEAQVDWPALLQLASRHRVVPLLYWGLQRTRPEAVPPPVLTQLEAQVRSALGRSLFSTRELRRLLLHFAAQGIPALPFKGPVLAAALYGDLALRQYYDLDILVRQADFPQAKRLLLSLGYQPLYLLTRRQEKAYRRLCHHAETFTLASDGARVVVDLHWVFTSRDFPFHPDLDGLWVRCEPMSLAGTTVATLAPEDVLLILCVHGSKHGWSRLQWICDVARLVQVHPTIAWGRVMEQARISGSQRRLFLGLCVANDLLAMPLPPEIEPQVQHDPQTMRLARRVRRRLLEGSAPVPTPWGRMLFSLQLLERGQDRLAYGLWALRALMSPTPIEWTSVPLPDPLFLVYYALRPLRLAGKYGLRAVQHLYTRMQGR